MSDFDGFDGFEERARAAGRGLGAVMPRSVDAARPRQRLLRRRIAAATAAFVVVAGVGGGVALARDGGDHTTVHVANDDTTTTAATTSTSAPGTSTTSGAPPTTAAPVTVTTEPTWSGPPVTCVIGGNVVGVSADGPIQVTHEGGYELAYLVTQGEIHGRADSVIVVPNNGHPMRTLADMVLVGAGLYHGDDVAITLDLHPDVLHSNWRWVSLYDLANGTLTRTKLSIAPGTTLDHVSVAGDLFVLSGKSAEGGPFVLYQHVDGSFDTTLPNLVAGNLTPGEVHDAVISGDGTRIAYLVNDQEVAVADVHSGRLLEQFENADAGAPPSVALDFDGRWAVVSHGAGQAAVVYDTRDARQRPIPGTSGVATIVRQ